MKKGFFADAPACRVEERILPHRYAQGQDDGVRHMMPVLFLRQAGAGLGDIRCHFKFKFTKNIDGDGRRC